MNNTNKTASFITGITLVLFIAVCSAITANAAEETAVAKVVYHADYAEPQRMSSMLTSIFNMVTTYENQFMDYDIRIVFPV